MAIPGSPRQYKGSALPGVRSATPFTILGVVLAIGGFAAALLLSGVFTGGGRGAATGPGVPVLVAVHEIGLRTALSPSDVTIRQMAQGDVPPGAFKSAADVKGLVAAVTIPKDQPVTSNLLVNSPDLVTGGQAAFLPIATGFVALTVPTSEQQGVAGFIQAAVNFVILLAAGVDAPLTWAVLFFFLNFIPGVGFALALVPPAVLALLEYGWQRALIVVVGYWVVNLIGDNVIKPRFFVKGLDISFTTIVFAVVFWSWVLGPAGAILAVPLALSLKRMGELMQRPA